jgi:hypothetical protein
MVQMTQAKLDHLTHQNSTICPMYLTRFCGKMIYNTQFIFPEAKINSYWTKKILVSIQLPGRFKPRMGGKY